MLRSSLFESDPQDFPLFLLLFLGGFFFNKSSLASLGFLCLTFRWGLLACC